MLKRIMRGAALGMLGALAVMGVLGGLVWLAKLAGDRFGQVGPPTVVLVVISACLGVALALCRGDD